MFRPVQTVFKSGIFSFYLLHLLTAPVFSQTNPPEQNAGWFEFKPGPDPFKPDSSIDLRFLNEKFAGEHGWIKARGPEFVHSDNDSPVRFWAVNGPPEEARDANALKTVARTLAKRGVNLVRVHSPLFDENGEVNPGKIKRSAEIVEAMKSEGIYTLFSIYFPLWFKPKPENQWLPGYNGKQHPFATLMFNPRFQQQYQSWWKALLSARTSSGKTLADEPAVAGLEIQNEDSFFFWTFNEQNIPDVHLRLLEKQFGDWVQAKYGSIEKGLSNWNGLKAVRDQPAEGRLGFRPLWNIANEKSLRDRDTALFLYEIQSAFYRESIAFLRKSGFKGVITASNWATASPEVLGPLEKMSYLASDFIDRHGYFSISIKGEFSEWSLRQGHVYADRSALRFEAEKPGAPKLFTHPAMDPTYDNKPSMISETTWNRPNRHRSEAPLFYALYGSLQGSDAIVHFALDGMNWSAKPGYFVQPWTLMSPAMIGQFPAAALIYRRGLIAEGTVLARIELNTNDLFQLKGTPLPQDAAFDELRIKDIPLGMEEIRPGQRMDPLIHLAGRVAVSFGGKPGHVSMQNLTPWIDRKTQTVTSTTGELKLDYGKGTLQIQAPKVQGFSGNLALIGQAELSALSLKSDLEVGHVVLISLDDKPLQSSKKMLLQVMSEEKSLGFETEPAEEGFLRIKKLGNDVWTVRKLSGTVHLKRGDAKNLKVTALDHNGYPSGAAGNGAEIQLQPSTLYYLISE